MSKKLLAARIINFSSLIIVSSVMFGTLLELSPARLELSGPAYAELEQKLHPHGVFMFPAILIAIISTAYIVFLLRKQRDASFYLMVLAMLAIIIAFVVTVNVHLPINVYTDKWPLTNLPADWMYKRSIWENWHPIRAWGSVIALVCAIASTMTSKKI